MTAGRPGDEAPEAGALRLLLTLALAPGETADLLARATGADCLWPSAAVAALGEAARADEHVWRDVSATLDRRLGPWLADLDGRPLRERLSHLSGDAALDIPALAALLWSLVRRRQRALGPLLGRLALEVEGLIVADAGRRARDLRGEALALT